MEISSGISRKADHSGARETEDVHHSKMSSTMSPGTDQGTATEAQQMPRDALDDRIDELEQRLAALTTDNSPSRSSNASFRTAREQTSPIRLSQNTSRKRKEQDSPRRPIPVLYPPQGSGLQSSPPTQTSSRPTTSHRASTRPSTRRSSTAPSSQVASASSSRREARGPTSTRPSASSSRGGTTGPNPQGGSASSSRRSSFKVNQAVGAQTSGPARLNRRYNSTWPPPEVIHDGRQALQSVRAFSDLRDDIFSDMRAEERLRSSSLPTLPRPATADTTAASLLSTAVDLAGESSQNLQEFSNHVPAANIDWTLPSTRRREYEKIDKARSGFRGLMRRVTPRILWKNGRVGFHDDGNGSDAGTVRRFRMDVLDGDIAVDEIANGPWWKFGKMTLKAGKSPTEEGTELRDLERAGEEYAIANHGGPVEDGQQAEARKGNPGGDAVDEGEGSGLMTVTGRAASSPQGAYEEADGHKPTTNNEMPIADGTNKGDKHKNAAEGRSKSGVKGRKEANMKWNCFSLGRKKLGHA